MFVKSGDNEYHLVKKGQEESYFGAESSDREFGRRWSLGASTSLEESSTWNINTKEYEEMYAHTELFDPRTESLFSLLHILTASVGGTICIFLYFLSFSPSLLDNESLTPHMLCLLVLQPCIARFCTGSKRHTKRNQPFCFDFFYL